MAHTIHSAILAHLAPGPRDVFTLMRDIPPAEKDNVAFAIHDLRDEGLIHGPDRGGRYSLTPDARAQLGIDRYALADIAPVAERLAADLRAVPDLFRVEIGGSIRRRQPTVKDIELCCLVEPPADLFGAPLADGPTTAAGWLAGIASYVAKSGPRYTQATVPAAIGPVTVDLFVTCDPACWGRLWFVRTGSRDFVMRADAYYKRQTGGSIQENRYLDTDGTPLPTPGEEDVFRLLGCRVVPPEQRTPRE